MVGKCCGRPRLEGFVLVRFLSSWLDLLVAERSAHPKDFYCNLQHTLSPCSCSCLYPICAFPDNVLHLPG